MGRRTLDLVSIMTVLSITFTIIGITSSLYSALILRRGTIFDYVFTTWFWLASLFFGIQNIAYFLSFHRSSTKYADTIDNSYVPVLRDKVAVLVPIYNEDPEMVITNLVAIYSNVGENAIIYVLDDSTVGEPAAVMNICEKLGMKYVHRTNRRGYKAGALNDVLKTLEEPYAAVVDIDQMPAPDFLRETIALFEKNEKIGFVQVPQEYSNTDSSLVAEMAQAQQYIFYDILTEGKSVAGTLFSCGTNVIYRVDALKSAGYFDETNIVEDMATSVNMAINGWVGMYYNKKLVFGRAPITMEGYINQQWRWMYGSISLMPKVIKKIIFSPKFSRKQKLDWFSTSTWYIFGWFYLIFLIAPMLQILGVRVLTVNTFLYFLAWLPYTILLMTTFVLSQVSKKEPLRFIFYNMTANLLLFPLSISASISALLGKSKPFTTARTGGKLPFYHFWPQLIIIVLLPIAGIYLLLLHTTFTYITSFWAIFQFILLMPLFWLNRNPRVSSMDDPAFKNYM
jgi:cellulose synthase (UDP-forming)